MTPSQALSILDELRTATARVQEAAANVRQEMRQARDTGAGFLPLGECKSYPALQSANETRRKLRVKYDV